MPSSVNQQPSIKRSIQTCQSRTVTRRGVSLGYRRRPSKRACAVLFAGDHDPAGLKKSLADAIGGAGEIPVAANNNRLGGRQMVFLIDRTVNEFYNIRLWRIEHGIGLAIGGDLFGPAQILGQKIRCLFVESLGSEVHKIQDQAGEAAQLIGAGIGQDGATAQSELPPNSTGNASTPLRCLGTSSRGALQIGTAKVINSVCVLEP